MAVRKLAGVKSFGPTYFWKLMKDMQKEQEGGWGNRERRGGGGRGGGGGEKGNLQQIAQFIALTRDQKPQFTKSASCIWWSPESVWFGTAIIFFPSFRASRIVAAPACVITREAWWSSCGNDVWKG
jgi:hypothetical protein